MHQSKIHNGHLLTPKLFVLNVFSATFFFGYIPVQNNNTAPIMKYKIKINFTFYRKKNEYNIREEITQLATLDRTIEEQKGTKG